MNCTEYAKLSSNYSTLKPLRRDFSFLSECEEDVIPANKLLLPKKQLDFMKLIGREWVRTLADYEVFCISTGYDNQFEHKTAIQYQLSTIDTDGTNLYD